VSQFGLPTGTPSGFNQVGSPDALTSQSGMISGLYAAADSWDATGSTLQNVASALGTDASTLSQSWEGPAATSSINEINKTITAANQGAASFHQYADSLRQIAAYIKKIRHIKALLHNIWKLILVDIFVALAAMVLGFVFSELIGAALPVLMDLVSALGLTGDVGDLVDGVTAVDELTKIGETIPEVTSDGGLDSGQVPEAIGSLDHTEPTVTPEDTPVTGANSGPLSTTEDVVPKGPTPEDTPVTGGNSGPLSTTEDVVPKGPTPEDTPVTGGNSGPLSTTEDVVPKGPTPEDTPVTGGNSGPQ